RPALLPREHGAYVQLGLPLVTALAVTGPSTAGLWLTAAALACFLAYEPLLLVLGQRGARRRDEAGALAWRRGLTLAGLGVFCGVLGVLGLPDGARPYLALPAILGAEVLLMTWGRQGRTLSGELLAALALTAWAVPVALAGGLPPGAALTLWGTFALGFSLATVAVHVVIRAHEPRADRSLPRLAGLAAGGFGLAGAVVWALTSGLSPWHVAALLPMAAVALGTCAVLPAPRHLRRLGWSFAAAGLITAVLLTMGLS
ncbi:YwiC-like family protein, partial [Pyxidicoccus fallax]